MTRATVTLPPVLLGLSIALLGVSSGCAAGGPDGALRRQAHELFDCSHVSIRRLGPRKDGPGIFVVEGCGGEARVACTDSVKAMGWRCQEPGDAGGAWAPILAKRERCRGCASTPQGCAREQWETGFCAGRECPEGADSDYAPCPDECCD